jgi:hypothetical protein
MKRNPEIPKFIRFTERAVGGLAADLGVRAIYAPAWSKWPVFFRRTTGFTSGSGIAA